MYGSSMLGRALRCVARVMACLAAATFIAACGSDGGDEDPPAISDIPAGAVAIVGDEVVSKRELERRIRAVRRSQVQSRSQSADGLASQAMALLLQQIAIEQEAKEHGVGISEREVRRLLVRTRRQFKQAEDFKRFLGRQTVQDLSRQLRIQALADKLADRVREDGGDSKDLIGTLELRWRERTACRPGYVVAACRNGRAPG